MEYTTIQKNISSSPRKLRLLADMVRKMSPEKALDILAFTNKAAALPLSKAIKTAVANSGSLNGLNFKKLEINEGIKMKRMRSGSRSHVSYYRKRLSQIKIVLTDEMKDALLKRSEIKALRPVDKDVVKDKEAESKADLKGKEA